MKEFLLSVLLFAEEIGEIAPTLWDQLTEWCSNNAPTLYTIIGTLTSGSFILLIWKGIPTIAKLFGLNDSTTAKVQQIVDNGNNAVVKVAQIYAKKVDELIGELNDQYALSQTKDDIIVQLLYTIITDSKIQAAGKSYATELLTKFESLTTKNVAIVQAQLAEKLQQEVKDIPSVIAEANKEVAEQNEEVSIIKAIGGE